MNLVDFMRTISDELEGQFSEYDEHTSVIVVPLGKGRFQAVRGRMQMLDDQGTKTISFISKVCPFYEHMDLVDFMAENKKMLYSRFVVDDTFVKVEASVFREFVNVQNKEYLKSAICEVAQVADKWEQKLTGLDVF
ncbi:hypothetical protein [Tunicatimonas pelagia]|uniref:hypothetical protein n=1 Tax=Tunicatimonas pelagia TaxID=931531 RepID=UPI0026655109|nr:hypothetical protein [Tunicatimonas pelagia]WKN45364.1 hypothetical protein P0M28_10380 [Tunicatimonas pelagia]